MSKHEITYCMGLPDTQKMLDSFLLSYHLPFPPLTPYLYYVPLKQDQKSS